MRILLVLSTLKRSGPVNVVYGLLSHLETVSTTILTLSPEPSDSRWNDFAKLGINLKSLGMKRLDGLIRGRERLSEYLASSEFDVVHTHGFRADVLLAKLNGTKWVSTAHNYPYDDYPMKFGRWRGRWMAQTHMKALGVCEHVVSCSRAIEDQLAKHGVISRTIQNGVDLVGGTGPEPSASDGLQRPVFITTGSLITRKNVRVLIDAFKMYRRARDGSLLVVGEGPERGALEAYAGDSVVFTGQVSNVQRFLSSADCFISASRSEGLPNSVLEAFAARLPAILSDIPSHRELHDAEPRASSLFSLEDGPHALATRMSKFVAGQLLTDAAEGTKAAANMFSAQKMAEKYQLLYDEIANQ